MILQFHQDLLQNEHHQIQKVIIASSRAIYGEGKYNCKKHGIIYPDKRKESDLKKGRFNPICNKCGKELELRPTDEKSKIDPQYPYALTKYLGEQLVIHWAKLYNMPNVSLRFFNAYGPRSRTTGAYGAVFGVFLAQKLAKKPLTIVGDGNQTRDFIHVFDLVDAIIKAAQKGSSGDIYNVGNGKETSVNSIANMIGGEKVNIPNRPGEPNRSLADITRIKTNLNWEPKISINHGIDMLLENINDWKEAPVWTPNTIKEATKIWFKHLKNNTI